MAEQAAEQARQQAQAGADKARGAVRTQVDQRSTQAGQQLSTQAGDVRSVADQLREQGKEGPAKVAEQAADRVERIGSYLEQSDADRLIHDVEDYARSNPWAVALGGLALGFAASRVLKASSQQRTTTSSQGGTMPYGGRELPAQAFADRGVGGDDLGRSVPAVQPTSAPPVPAAPVGVGAQGTDPRSGTGQWSS